MSQVPQRATPRWKEWIPLVTQQQRLRNLIQVLAYNVPWYPGSSLYFTLHLTSMSPPFYTSERLQHQHPKWGEMELGALGHSINTCATGVVVRLWLSREGQTQDKVVLVWGVHFSGLVYLGPRLTATAAQFKENTIVLHLQGGYFTNFSCPKELPASALVRNISVTLLSSEVRPSYSVPLLLRLRNIQQAIKKQTQQANVLREKILAGGMSSGDAALTRESNPTLRKLLNRGRPKPQPRQEILAARCHVELIRFRVSLLRREKHRKLAQVESLQKQKDLAAVNNSDHSCELTERYRVLNKEIELLRESRRQYTEMRESYLLKSAQLSCRRKQLMTQLNLIYPVVQMDGKYTICGIHLPNSEDLSSTDDVTVSVALGYVAHLVQMVSIFLQVPLRYPIIHFGSRSKIIDYITDKIPDKEREFPLFARGKDKLQFHYGVYLLNKDIAHLRWLVGFPTTDLRATLHNVYHLLHLNQFPSIDNHHRSVSGSSLDIVGSSANVSPVGSVSAVGSSFSAISNSGHLRARHRSSKSMGSSELLFHGSRRSTNNLIIPFSQHTASDGMATSANLSYSLDKGLDEYEEIKKAEDCNSGNNTSGVTLSAMNQAYVGSEPNLVMHSDHQIRSTYSEHVPKNLEPNAQVQFLQRWHAGGAPVCSDDDAETISLKKESEVNFSPERRSEFSIVTERIVELVDSSKRFQCADVDTKLDHCNSEPVSLKEQDVEISEQVQSCVCTEEQQQSASQNDVSYSEEACENSSVVPSSINTNHGQSDQLVKCSSISDIEVDLGTDALAADISNSPLSSRESTVEGLRGKSTKQMPNIPSGSQRSNDARPLSEKNGLECSGVEESVLVDNLFASVTSRTEALASHTTSFNLMGSRYGSS